MGCFQGEGTVLQEGLSLWGWTVSVLPVIYLCLLKGKDETGTRKLWNNTSCLQTYQLSFADLHSVHKLVIISNGKEWKNTHKTTINTYLMRFDSSKFTRIDLSTERLTVQTYSNLSKIAWGCTNTPSVAQERLGTQSAPGSASAVNFWNWKQMHRGQAKIMEDFAPVEPWLPLKGLMLKAESFCQPQSICKSDSESPVLERISM